MSGCTALSGHGCPGGVVERFGGDQSYLDRVAGRHQISWGCRDSRRLRPSRFPTRASRGEFEEQELSAIAGASGSVFGEDDASTEFHRAITPVRW